jgi:hypothetical protein
MNDEIRKARALSIVRQFKQFVPGETPMEVTALRSYLTNIAALLASMDIDPAEPSYQSVVEDALNLVRYVNPVFGPEPTVEMNNPGAERNWLMDGRNWNPRGYWARYSTWLTGTRSKEKLAALDATTNSIIGQSGNPEWEIDAWDRRGVVVGQVQSGKTETYIGVLAKAIDAGYKSIVVLAGIHNDLRAQTQLRIDEGIVGATHLDNEQFQQKPIGVGLLPIFQRQVNEVLIPMTSGRNDGDFSHAVAQIYSNPDLPHLFVIKKNVTVLKRLNKFFSENNAAIGFPLLLLDDESDQASVNTNEDTDPTKTNREIRILLNKFRKSSYIGFTATPFANIFIHPDAANEVHGSDLFPKDFIHRLKPSAEYFGPDRLFGIGDDVADDDRTSSPQLIVPADDWEDWIQPRHKRTFEPGELPESLLQALADFVVGAAIKRLRYGVAGDFGFDPEVGSHATMLIHVTRFVDVQKSVTLQIQSEAKRMREDLIGGSDQPDSWNNRVKHAFERIIETSDLLKESLSPDQRQWAIGKQFDYPQVLTTIRSMLNELEVAEVNGTVEDGLRYRTSQRRFVVAIGGDKLSRGLTLEGLSVSYFLRSAGTWDTLMQMGRWFGYRPRYLDLCRVYMPTDLSITYEAVTRAIDDLAQQFDTMASTGASPLDFGLRLPKLATGQLPTRKGAMAHAQVVLEAGHSGSLLEKLFFPTSGSALDRTHDALEKLFNACATSNSLSKLGNEDVKTHVSGFRGVNPTIIMEFLRGAGLPISRMEESTEDLCAYIEAQVDQERLTDWTVAFVGLSKNSGDQRPTYKVGTLTLVPSIRKTHPDGDTRTARRVKNLSSLIDETLDLTLDEYHSALDAASKVGKPVKRSDFRVQRSPKRALLLCYPVVDDRPTADSPVSVTWAISFPHIPGEVRTEYYITPAELRRRVGIDDQDEEDANE